MISMLSVRVVLMATVAAAIYHGHKTKTLAIYRSFAHFGEINYPDSLCGGVLITWKHVLTAAHCDISPKRHLVYLGTRVRHSPAHARYVARIERVDVHRMYRFTGGTDVALVTLRDDGDKRKINNRNGNSDSAFARRLKKAGIRPVDVDWGGLGLRVQGLRLYTMGFGGKRLQKRPPLTRNLRVISVYKLPTLTCVRRYFTMEDPNYSVCVRATAKSDASVCKGDSGGPLLAYNSDDNDNQPQLVGIIIARVASPSDWSCNPGAIILGMKVKPFRRFIERLVGSWRRW